VTASQPHPDKDEVKTLYFILFFM